MKEVTELIAELGSYSYSFIKTDSDHVILNAMKQMESFYEKEAIARFYETVGRDGDVAVEFPRPIRATESNLLEDVFQGWSSGDQTIHFRMMPREIKTLRVARH